MADFDQDKPAASSSLRVSNPQILDNQEALQDAINREHIFSGTAAGTQTGDHTQGSARAFSQATAPATRIDGDGFLSTDLGSIWIDTDDNQIYTLTATLPTWTPISTELYESFLADPRVFLDTLGVDGDFEVGTGSEFTVEAATGNVATDGTLDVAETAEVVGIATLGDASTLKTAASPTADAEIANKKYVDDQIQFSSYTRLDSTPVNMVKATEYRAATNGFVSATASLTDNDIMVGLVSDTSPATGGREVQKITSGASSTEIASIFFSVAAGQYFEIQCTNAATIYWQSVGPRSNPVNQEP